jgi:MFS family permease
VAAARRLLPDARPRFGRRLDVVGLLLLSPGIAVLLYGVSEAGNRGGFDSSHATVAALAGTVLVGTGLIGLFFWHAVRRGSEALIDVALLRRRGFAAGAALNLLLMVGLFGSLILFPLYYQIVRHDSPVQVGLLLAPQGVGAALALPLAGWLTDRVGARGITSAGIVVAALGTVAFTQIGPRTPDAFLAAALGVVGLGLGATVAPSMAAAFRALPHAEMPQGTSALNTIQRIAGAIGTALFAIILQHMISSRVPSHPGSLAGAFGATFWVAAALIATALGPALLLPRPPANS